MQQFGTWDSESGEDAGSMRIGALEAGGTKLVCAVGDENGRLLDRVSIPTQHPNITIPELTSYFKEQKIEALGIGCFGPLDLNPKSARYGSLLKTPKPGWAKLNIIKAFQEELDVPVGLDTDVNAAVLGEVVYGVGRGYDSVAYMTVGTGIGVGVYLEGRLVHGMLHPETGHMLVARHPRDKFKGCCSFHENCLEGFASGPVIQERWGKPASELTTDFDVLEMEAYYLAQGISNIVLCYSPQKGIIGGGVSHMPGMLELVREQVRRNLGGYIRHEQFDAEEYIVLPGCGDDAGILGALELGKRKLMGD